MFERFTDHARNVLACAQEEAGRMHSEFVTPGHLLLGLLREDQGVATQALSSLGVTYDTLLAYVKPVSSPGAGSVHTFSNDTKRILEISLREALALDHSYAGPEHLLLAISRVGDGPGARTLRELGVEASTLRSRIIELVVGHPLPAPPPSTKDLLARLSTAPQVPSALTEAISREILQGVIAHAVAVARLLDEHVPVDPDVADELAALLASVLRVAALTGADLEYVIVRAHETN